MSYSNAREPWTADFPANSRKAKSNTENLAGDKKLPKVVTGVVKKQKRGFGKKIAETFLEDDTKSVGSYIFHDVLVPSAKDLIADMVKGAIEMLLFGEKRGRSSNVRRDGGKSYTSYGSYYKSSERDKERSRDISRTSRSRHDFDDIVLETRGEAEEVLSHLVDMTIDYGMATVADLYDLVGITSNFTDNKYGWTDLRTASVSRVRGGYLVNLPRTQPLD